MRIKTKFYEILIAPGNFCN